MKLNDYVVFFATNEVKFYGDSYKHLKNDRIPDLFSLPNLETHYAYYDLKDRKRNYMYSIHSCNVFK